MCPKMNQKRVVIIVSLCLCLTGLIGIAVAIAVGSMSADAPTTSATLTKIDNVTSDPTAETSTSTTASNKPDDSLDLGKELILVGQEFVDVLKDLFVPNTDTVKSDATTEASTTTATRQSDATTPGATPSNNVVASDITTGNTTAALGNQTKARKRPTKTTGSPSLIDLIIESI